MARLIALLLLLLALSASADSGLSAHGRQVYERGIGQDPVQVRIGTPGTHVPASAFACARCHGGNGLGGSEGGIAAPSLVPDEPVDAPRLRRWLQQALVDGRGNDGRELLAVMPRYALSSRDMDALAAHLVTLPYPPRPGLEARSLRLSLDMDGAPLDARQRAATLHLLQQALAQRNAEGGLYGRQLQLLEADDTQALLGIGWRSDARRAIAHIAVRPLDSASTPPCMDCCGSLHAELRTQAAWLQQALLGAGWQPQWLGSRAPMLRPGGGGDSAQAAQAAPTATVLLGMREELADVPAGTVYVLGEMDAWPSDGGHRLLAVASGELAQQIQAVQRLQQAVPELASPRAASAALQLSRALDMAVDALAEGGRRIDLHATCERLRNHSLANQHFSLLRLSDGAVLAEPPAATSP